MCRRYNLAKHTWHALLLSLGFVLVFFSQFVGNVRAYDDGFTITIPAIGVQAPIVPAYIRDFGDGRITWDVSSLRMQVAHLDQTAWFGQGGNVVLGGHSQVSPTLPDIFINLDSLQPGDEIIINGGGQVWRYVVASVGRVHLNDLSPVYPTGDNRLTIITCDTQTWDNTQSIYTGRVVVVAYPVAEEPASSDTAPHELSYLPDYTLNLRTAPTTAADVLVQVPSGGALPVVGRSADAQWLKVRYNGLDGWVALGYGRFNGDINSLPIMAG